MKKKYNKPLINITTVRNEMGFCGSIVNEPKGAVKSEGHAINEIDLGSTNTDGSQDYEWNNGQWD